MRLAPALLLVALAACSPDADTAAVGPAASEPPAAPAEAEAAPAGAPSASAGTAHVVLTGEGVDVEGNFPATLCGGPYLLGEGWAFQTQAGDWQVTIASENEAEAGEVPLNASDDQVNVVVTANGPGSQFVRRPSDAGTVRLGDGRRMLEADLELRGIVTRETAHLTATFTCE